MDKRSHFCRVLNILSPFSRLPGDIILLLYYYSYSLRARFNEEKKGIQFNFLNWIELNFDVIGKKMNNQEGVSIMGRGKFD